MEAIKIQSLSSCSIFQHLPGLRQRSWMVQWSTISFMKWGMQCIQCLPELNINMLQEQGNKIIDTQTCEWRQRTKNNTCRILINYWLIDHFCIEGARQILQKCLQHLWNILHPIQEFYNQLEGITKPVKNFPSVH